MPAPPFRPPLGSPQPFTRSTFITPPPVGATESTGGVASAATVDGTAVLTFSASGGVTAAGALVGTAAQTFSATGGVTSAGSLSGAGAETFAASGGVAVAATIGGTGAETFDAPGGVVAGATVDAVATYTPLAITGAADVAAGGTLDGLADNGVQPVVEYYGGGRYTPRPIVSKPIADIYPNYILPLVIHGAGSVTARPSISAIASVAESEDWLVGLGDSDEELLCVA